MRGRSGRPRGIEAGVLLCVGWLLSGYGYGPDQDPLLTRFKLVAAHAHAGRWEEARDASLGLAPALDEIAATFGLDLGPRLQQSLRDRDAGALARHLTSLAYLSVELKLESSRREELSRYYEAKYRIEAARSYYAELVAPLVRRHDRNTGSDAHRRIWSGFDDARAALGRPGFLGRGVAPPDRDAFEAAANEITNGFREVFPFLPEGVP